MKWEILKLIYMEQKDLMKFADVDLSEIEEDLEAANVFGSVK